MKYVLSNFTVADNSLLDQKFTNELFKAIAYNAKYKVQRSKNVTFKYVAIPMEDYIPDGELELALEFAKSKTSVRIKLTDEEKLQLYSIYKFFISVKDEHFTFDVIMTIDDTKMDIFYSDGSSSKSLGQASYATIQLLEEVKDGSGVYDDFSQRHRKYMSFAGVIDDGTNNIGELTGVKTAITNAGSNQIQVIISDSEYSIKCFREWIHRWKTNGYKGSNNKGILNCELIKSIQQAIEDSGKIFLFKWTKGHADQELNEMCDALAKEQLGIEKK